MEQLTMERINTAERLDDVLNKVYAQRTKYVYYNGVNTRMVVSIIHELIKDEKIYLWRHQNGKLYYNDCDNIMTACSINPRVLWSLSKNLAGFCTVRDVHNWLALSSEDEEGNTYLVVDQNRRVKCHPVSNVDTAMGMLSTVAARDANLRERYSDFTEFANEIVDALENEDCIPIFLYYTDDGDLYLCEDAAPEFADRLYFDDLVHICYERLMH